MEAVKRLKEKFLKGGGTVADFEAIGRGFLELGDTELQDGSTRPTEARKLSRKCFQGGALIQMSCYDGRGQPQGDAVIIFERWVDDEQLLFKASHLVASNEYYEWWSVNEADFSKLVFHICEKPRHRCKVVGAEGEETVHITKWRMASPQTLIGNGFGSTQALSYFANALDYHLATMRRAVPGPGVGEAPERGDGGGEPAAPVARPAVQTTGLDGAADGMDRVDRAADEMVDDLLALAHEAKKGPGAKKKDPRKDRSSDKGLGRLLADRAAAHGDEARDRHGDRRKKRKKDEDDEERTSKRKRLKPEDSDSGDSSDSEVDFRVASSREVDLVRLSKENPGCLLRSALKEMSRYLAARGEASKEDIGNGRVLSYLHQILLPQYPKAGIRSHRELVTLGTALDYLLEGKLGLLGDLLAQRFKAIEASLAADGNWAVARHQELIPVQASLSTKAELSEAAKAELRAQKLKAQLTRGGPHGGKSG